MARAKKSGLTLTNWTFGSLTSDVNTLSNTYWTHSINIEYCESLLNSELNRITHSLSLSKKDDLSVTSAIRADTAVLTGRPRLQKVNLKVLFIIGFSRQG